MEGNKWFRFLEGKWWFTFGGKVVVHFGGKMLVGHLDLMSLSAHFFSFHYLMSLLSHWFGSTKEGALGL